MLNDELEDELEEVTGRMHARKWPGLVFGTLCTIAAAAMPLGTTLTAGATLGTAAAAPGLAGAIYSAYRQTGSDKKERNAPLASLQGFEPPSALVAPW